MPPPPGSGLPAVGPLTAFLLAASGIAGCASWMAGSARVAYAAAREGQWPAPLGALHRRYRTPHVALIAQGVIATLIFLSSLFLTIGGGTTTVQESYDILVNLTIVVYFVPYVYLFVGLMRLLKGPELTLGLRLAAVAGLAATVISMILVFVPPSGTANVLNYEVNLIWQTAAVLAGGIGLYYFGRRQKRAEIGYHLGRATCRGCAGPPAGGLRSRRRDGHRPRRRLGPFR